MTMVKHDVANRRYRQVGTVLFYLLYSLSQNIIHDISKLTAMIYIRSGKIKQLWKVLVVLATRSLNTSVIRGIYCKIG